MLYIYTIINKTKTNDMTTSNPKSEILQSYSVASNEQVVCIENFEGASYKVYAVYVNGEYDRRIKVAKF